MNNFPIQHENKTYWVSRSIAVAGFVFTKINDEYHVLANKRGSGVPNYQGYWNVPCGYLDYNETTAEAVCRETFEETGVVIKPNLTQLWNIDDDPKSTLQNVTFIYFNFLPERQDISISDRGGETNEVELVSWIPILEIDKYKWAFGHDKIINEMITYFNLDGATKIKN